MDIATILEAISLIEIAESNTKEDPKYNGCFECSTKEEYQAYLKGQADALRATIQHLKACFEKEFYGTENSTGE